MGARQDKVRGGGVHGNLELTYSSQFTARTYLKKRKKEKVKRKGVRRRAGIITLSVQ
jgi:hypothetical protein